MPATLRIRVEIELTEAEALSFAGVAYKYGFQREEPRRRWSTPELKEAARYAILGMVRDWRETRGA